MLLMPSSASCFVLQGALLLLLFQISHFLEERVSTWGWRGATWAAPPDVWALQCWCLRGCWQRRTYMP